MEYLWRTFVSVVLTSIVTFMATSYWNRKKAIAAVEEATKTRVALSDARIVELENKLAVLGSQVTPISAAFQAVLIKQLTHYHTPKLDALLLKLGPPVTLTQAEEKEFSVELEMRTRDMGPEITSSERDAAKMLPMVIARVREETEALTTKVDLAVVAIPQADDGTGNK